MKLEAEIDATETKTFAEGITNGPGGRKRAEHREEKSNWKTLKAIEARRAPVWEKELSCLLRAKAADIVRPQLEMEIGSVEGEESGKN